MTIRGIGKDVEQMESHTLLTRKENGSYFGKQFLMRVNVPLPHGLAVLPLSIYLKGQKTHPHKGFYVNVHDSFIHKQSKYPSTGGQINKLGCIHIMEYYLATKRNELLIHITARM